MIFNLIQMIRAERVIRIGCFKLVFIPESGFRKKDAPSGQPGGAFFLENRVSSDRSAGEISVYGAADSLAIFALSSLRELRGTT